MKRIFLSIVGSVLIGVCAVQAQQDEAASKSKKKDKQQKNKSEQTSDTHWNRDQAWQQQSDRSQYANEGMVEIDKGQIPSSLKETLQDEKYAGWENATIYHNTNTGEYVIAPRAYRFDDKGNEIEVGDDNAYGSSRSSGYSTGDRSSSDQMNQQSSQSREPGQMSQDQSSQDQLNNGQATDQSQYNQSGNEQKPSSGYRSGQDAASDPTNSSQTDGASTTPGTTSGNQTQNSGTSPTDGTTNGNQSQSQSQNTQDQ